MPFQMGASSGDPFLEGISIYILKPMYISIVHFLVGNYDCIQSNMMLTTAVVLYAPLGHFTFLESIDILQHLKSELQTLKHTKNRTVGLQCTSDNNEPNMWRALILEIGLLLVYQVVINVKLPIYYIAFLVFSLLFLN